MSGRPIGRLGRRHLVDGRRIAWRTAMRPLVARSDRRLNGGQPLCPPVRVAVGRADGLADPSAWDVRHGPSARDRPPSRNFGGP
jgi:hypothetical protein